MVCLHYPTVISITIPIKCRKATLGPIPMMILMQSNNESQLENHLIGTDICVKLFTVPICIGIGISIGIDMGPL